MGESEPTQEAIEWTARANAEERAGRRSMRGAVCRKCLGFLPMADLKGDGMPPPGKRSCVCGETTTRRDVEMAILGYVPSPSAYSRRDVSSLAVQD